MKSITTPLFIVMVIATVVSVHGQFLTTFPNIPGRTPSDKYVCRVRVVGTNSGKDAFVLQTISKSEITVNGSNISGYKNSLLNWTASWIAF